MSDGMTDDEWLDQVFGPSMSELVRGTEHEQQIQNLLDAMPEHLLDLCVRITEIEE